MLLVLVVLRPMLLVVRPSGASSGTAACHCCKRLAPEGYICKSAVFFDPFERQPLAVR